MWVNRYATCCDRSNLSQAEKKLLLPILSSEGHSSLFVIFITEERVLVPSRHPLQPVPRDKLASLKMDELRGYFHLYF